MKISFNFTTSEEDLVRYTDRADFETALDGFDGIELMAFNDDTEHMVQPQHVVGVHLSSFHSWCDFWRGDEEAVMREFNTLEEVERYYGGATPQALVDRVKSDLTRAHEYNPEYVVFHVSETTVEESVTFKFKHTHEEVIEAACEILNLAFAEEDGSVALLMENLWHSGLTMTDPHATQQLLDGVAYPNKGIMLDTGHLMHTNFDLQSQEEALAYIRKRLDEHGDLCRHIRGMHLNQSLTGNYCKQLQANPPALAAPYSERMWQAFEFAFKIDRHQPFTCNGVCDLIAEIAPEYLTLEFISATREEHEEMLGSQLQALQPLLRG